MGILLAPPIIEGNLPAFYAKENGTVTITVPFSMNRAVNKKEVIGFQLKIKTIQNSSYLLAIESNNILDYEGEKISNEKFDNYFINHKVIFELNSDQAKLLSVGEFYKIQIAYKGKDNIGKFSTVGIAKYTTRPKVFLNNMDAFSINSHVYNYQGYYSQEEGDITEKVYSYRFILYDNDNNIIKDTGDLIHNYSEDTEPYESQDFCSFPEDLPTNKIYRIRYGIKTNNGLEIYSKPYKIMQKKSLFLNSKIKILPKLNFSNGYILINALEENKKPLSGGFILLRASQKNDFKDWFELSRFNLYSQSISAWSYKDFTIQQGETYIYALQQYNDEGLYSEKILSESIYSDFEDAFLFDGARQLKIRFNPKINSFKIDKLESKIETIGSKYPFIFKNGNVEYKEFPISGLISYLSDEENLFSAKEDLELNKEFSQLKRPSIKYYPDYELASPEEQQRILIIDSNKNKEIINSNKNITTNLQSENIAAERKFKLEVLDWLTNGKAKLFRSPTEGNYLVRLMNVSLSPEDTLGRMLHNFSATAYEIAENTMENLNNLDIISLDQKINLKIKQSTLPLFSTNGDKYANDSRYIRDDKNQGYFANGELLKNIKAEEIEFSDMIPGDVIIVDGQRIIIGSTGSYKISMPVSSVIIPDKSQYYGLFTFSYYGTMKNEFNYIKDVDNKEILGRQFIGLNYDLLNKIFDIKTRIPIFYSIKGYKRPIGQAYYNEEDGFIYEDLYYTKPIINISDKDGNINKDNLINADKLQLYLYHRDNININNKQYELYKQVYFIDSEKKGEKDLIGNPYYIDVNNYLLYLQTKQLFVYRDGVFKKLKAEDNPVFNPKELYWIKESIEMLVDPLDNQTPILTKKAYKHFEEMLEFLSQVSPNRRYDLIHFIQDYEKYETNFSFNNEIFSLEEKEVLIFKDPPIPEQLSCSRGVYLECNYQAQKILYSIEVENTPNSIAVLQANIKHYDYILSRQAIQDLNKAHEDENDEIVSNEEAYLKELTTTRNNYYRDYNNYIFILKEELKKISKEEEE